MNIMLTCVGRRGYVVDFFKAALKGRGSVIVCDSSPGAPALQAGDHAYVVPKIRDPSYIGVLLEIVRRHGVRLLVPAFEPELLVLCDCLKRFEEAGTTVLIPSRAVIGACYDKLETGKFLARCGIATPASYLSPSEARGAIARGELEFPLIVKARWGVGSLGCETARDEEELTLAFRLVQLRLTRDDPGGIHAGDPARCVLIQPRLSGREYGLDVINDLDGNHVCTLARRKLRMRAGVTDRATTLDDPRLERLGRVLGENLGHVGLLDCDVYVTGNECQVLDLNPRIGGGYPFSHLAGADFPRALIAWLEGTPVDPRWLAVRPGVTAARYDGLEIVAPCGGEAAEAGAALIHVNGG